MNNTEFAVSNILINDSEFILLFSLVYIGNVSM